MSNLQKNVASIFREHFGVTPLKRRVDDILRETLEVHRFTDNNHLREELGDLLASAIMCAEEQGWDYRDLVTATLMKIVKRSSQILTLS